MSLRSCWAGRAAAPASRRPRPPCSSSSAPMAASGRRVRPSTRLSVVDTSRQLKKRKSPPAAAGGDGRQPSSQHDDSRGSMLAEDSEESGGIVGSDKDNGGSTAVWGLFDDIDIYAGHLGTAAGSASSKGGGGHGSSCTGGHAGLPEGVEHLAVPAAGAAIVQLVDSGAATLLGTVPAASAACFGPAGTVFVAGPSGPPQLLKLPSPMALTLPPRALSSGDFRDPTALLHVSTEGAPGSSRAIGGACITDDLFSALFGGMCDLSCSQGSVLLQGDTDGCVYVLRGDAQAASGGNDAVLDDLEQPIMAILVASLPHSRSSAAATMLLIVGQMGKVKVLFMGRQPGHLATSELSVEPCPILSACITADGDLAFSSPEGAYHGTLFAAAASTQSCGVNWACDIVEDFVAHNVVEGGSVVANAGQVDASCSVLALGSDGCLRRVLVARGLQAPPGDTPAGEVYELGAARQHMQAEPDVPSGGCQGLTLEQLEHDIKMSLASISELEVRTSAAKLQAAELEGAIAELAISLPICQALAASSATVPPLGLTCDIAVGHGVFGLQPPLGLSIAAASSSKELAAQSAPCRLEGHLAITLSNASPYDMSACWVLLVHITAAGATSAEVHSVLIRGGRGLPRGSAWTHTIAMKGLWSDSRLSSGTITCYLCHSSAAHISVARLQAAPSSLGRDRHLACMLLASVELDVLAAARPPGPALGSGASFSIGSSSRQSYQKPDNDCVTASLMLLLLNSTGAADPLGHSSPWHFLGFEERHTGLLELSRTRLELDAPSGDHFIMQLYKPSVVPGCSTMAAASGPCSELGKETPLPSAFHEVELSIRAYSLELLVQVHEAVASRWVRSIASVAERQCHLLSEQSPELNNAGSDGGSKASKSALKVDKGESKARQCRQLEEESTPYTAAKALHPEGEMEARASACAGRSPLRRRLVELISQLEAEAGMLWKRPAVCSESFSRSTGVCAAAQTFLATDLNMLRAVVETTSRAAASSKQAVDRVRTGGCSERSPLGCTQFTMRAPLLQLPHVSWPPPVFPLGLSA
eukprot:SM000319S12280  [mRNA]  locus=s319:104898:110826:- [translate_table: standard]